MFPGPEKAQITIRKGGRLGSGGFGVVYHATELSTGRQVALKQSRVSLRIKRSLLKHEAAVLKRLSQHPAIPEVYAYGRIEHFELLSMQLLHHSLGDTVDKEGPLPLVKVICVADQMLDALVHMQRHRLVHRDVKPDNILWQHADSPKICLVDFGLTYTPPRSLSDVQLTTTPLDVTTGVFGTLAYASLNAHNTQKLTYRDDLESLAYSLVWLLRGSLPWSHYTRHGNLLGRLRQVYEQKERHSGSRLAKGLPREFGALLDYARSLSVEAVPDYAELQKRFQQIPEPFPRIRASRDKEQNEKGRYFEFLDDPNSVDLCSSVTTSSSPPVEAGQIVLVQLNSSVTGEGRSIQAGHERSYVPNPCFDSLEWLAPRRPAVVTGIRWDKRMDTWSFTAVAIARRHDEAGAVSPAMVPILSAVSIPLDSPQVTVFAQPDWPLENAYCYAFRRPTKFYCLPTQECVPSTWRVVSADLSALVKALTPDRNPDLFAVHDEVESSDRDIRHDARMRDGNVKLYARILPLNQHQLADESIHWHSSRAWFDECVKASRYNDLENGQWWTNAPFARSPQSSEGEISDSYRGLDFEEWERQQERDESITLDNGPRGEGEEEAPQGILEELDEIVLENE
ncbi:hypothetical protein FRC10_006619 [Ceratobasidium sp. 414]|nr:hypothetical protein FRC10_006619 [Ceratobasidium sp. 414]